MDVAALVFGLIVTASCVEQLWFSQIQRDFPWPFLQDLARYAGRDYLVQFRGFGSIFNAMLLIEGLALFVWGAHECRLDPAFATRVLAMVTIGAAGAATLNISHAATVFVYSGEPAARIWTELVHRRWSAHIGDINAAGSYFAMCFVVALGGAVCARKATMAWLTAALVIGTALWMTQSRTAAAGVLVVAALVITSVVFSRSTNRIRAVLLTVLLVVPLWLLAVQYFAVFRTQAGSAMSIRWMFLVTTARMVRWAPVFGVGIGQYTLWARHFSPPDLIRQQLENAHDNFAQIAAELGATGFLALLYLLMTALQDWKRASRTNRLATAGFLGLVTFLISWLGTHPLLVPEVAYPFWIVLGAVAGLSLAPASPVRADEATSPGAMPARDLVAHARPRLQPAVVCGLLIAMLAVSMPVRIKNDAGLLDWTRISYGFYAWEEGPSGEQFRWTNARARFFVTSNVTRLTLPVRTYSGTPAKPIVVDLFINDHLANQIRLSDAAWRTVDVVLPRHVEGHFTHIDLRVDRTWVPSEDNPGSADSRRLGVQVGQVAIRSVRDATAGGLN
jgi:O-antigen ligase